MSWDTDLVISVGQVTKPGDSQYAYLLDTTYLGGTLPAYSTSINTVLGPSRWVVPGRRVEGTVLVAGQTVTVVFQILGGDGLWVTDTANAPDAGSKTLVADSLYSYRWLPTTPEYRIYVLAGATGPTAMYTTMNLIRDRSSGV